MRKSFVKKIASALLVSSLLVTSAPALTVAADTTISIDSTTVTIKNMDQTLYVIGDAGANIRVAPSTNYRIITHLDKGAQIQATGRTSNGWIRLYTIDPVYGGTTEGYISEGLLSSSKSSSSGSSSSSISGRDGEICSVSVKSFLSLRKGPSSDTTELGQLLNGSVVQIIGAGQNGYVPVNVKYAVSGSTGSLVSGYVYEKYLTSASVRVVSLNSFLSIRRSPDESSTELGRLTNGSVVTVLGSSKNGYVPAIVISAASGSTGTLVSGYVYEKYLTSARRTVSVNTFLSLRTGPSADTTELGRLTDGSVVMVTGAAEGSFIPVTVVSAASGSTGSLISGYVYSKYLS